MKRIIGVLLIIVMAISIAIYVNDSKESQLRSESRLSQYDDSYIGDNVAIGNILSASGISYDTFMLETKEKPFCISINYIQSFNSNKTKEEILYCSSLMFALIQNADQVRFIEEDKELFLIDREQINQFHNMDVSVLGEDQDELFRILKENITLRETVSEFYEDKPF